MIGASLNAARRAAELEQLAGGLTVDVAVVGGGITGAGVALDAATRGLSVALLERRDLAHGTSRWSSKLIHGGLRYLARHEWGLAWEAAAERALIMRTIAPHLVRAMPFLIPVDADGPPRSTIVGLRLGDAMRTASRLSRRALPPPRRVSALEARRLAPALRAEGLRGALLHWDGQLEDDARLVVAVARTAAAHGARVLTYTGATALQPGAVEARDELTGEALTVRARHVICATGVWAGALVPGVRLRPSKGAHVLVPAGRLGDPRAAVTVAVPGEKGRWVFTVPRPDGLVLVGLTDEPFDEAIPDEPEVEAAEEAFLLEAASRALEVPLRAEDVAGRYAGLRPLLAGAEGATADLSRRHAIVADAETGALCVVGGKLTTYRRMAQDVVDRITARPCRTRRLPLVGAGAPGDAPRRLVQRYGSEAAAIVAAWPDALEPVAPGVPVSAAELRFAVEHEGALTVDDLVHRRTRAGVVGEWRAAVAAAAAELAPVALAQDA